MGKAPVTNADEIDFDALDSEVEDVLRRADALIVEAIMKLNPPLLDRQALLDLEHGGAARKHYFSMHAQLMAMHAQLVEML